MKKSKNCFSKGAAFALLLGGMTLASCGDSNEFTKSNAENALEEYALLFNENSEVCTKTFNTGYFEVTPTEGNQLRKMVKAGVITCKFDVVVEEVKKYRYVGWDREEYIEKHHHIFANVQLTKEGQKYVAEESVKNQVREDYKKMVGNIQDEISKEQKAPEYATLADTIFYRDESTNQAEESKQKNNGYMANQSDNESPKSAYEIALSKVSVQPVRVRTNKLDLMDVFDVYADENMQKSNKGICKFTVQVTDLTPFAWSSNRKPKVEIGVFEAEFKKYEDKGWVVSHANITNMDDVFGVDIKPLPKEK